jgi:hypothetical protein
VSAVKLGDEAPRLNWRLLVEPKKKVEKCRFNHDK